MNTRTPIYIERQRTFSKQLGTFGPLGSISANGCGAIAVYNILEHFGMHEDFMRVIRRFERFWPIALPFGGFLGTNIFYLYYLLCRYGLSVRPLFFIGSWKRHFRLDSDEAILFFYGWRKGRQMGAHYQAGFGDSDGKIILHNSRSVYCGLEDLLKAKKLREKMWFSMALHVKK